jgi:hypothetical protein
MGMMNLKKKAAYMVLVRLMKSGLIKFDQSGLYADPVFVLLPL